MCDLKLLPCNDPGCSYLVRLDSEAAVFVVEHVGFLGKNPRKQPDDGPGKETTVRCRVASIKE